MLNSRILIISLSAGAGHVRAAEAIKKTADMSFPGIETKHIDMADFITLPMKKTVISSYALLAKKIPDLWGYLYEKSDNPNIARRFNKITKQLKNINSLRLYDFINEYDPSAIICTHFLPADVILNAPKSRRTDAPVDIVITDYDIHNLWIVENTSRYFVATKKMRWKLNFRGVATEKIIVSGIPVDPIFYQKKSPAALKKKHRADGAKKIILLLSGGQGMVDSVKIINTLARSNENLTIFAIAGKNSKLEESLRQIKTPDNIDLRPIGWTDDIDEFMRLADIIITKPGGITTSECIVLGKPIIAVDPIPGQEERNADYIQANNLGFDAHSPDDLLYYIEHFTPTQRQRPVLKPTAAEIILDSFLQ